MSAGSGTVDLLYGRSIKAAAILCIGGGYSAFVKFYSCDASVIKGCESVN